MTDKPNAPITDEHHKLVQELNRNLNLATQCQLLANRDRDLESRAVAGAYRAAAERASKVAYLSDSQQMWIGEELLALTSADAQAWLAKHDAEISAEAAKTAATYLTEQRDKAIREARIEGVEMCAEYLGHNEVSKPHYGCVICETRAALANPQGETR